MTTNILRIGLLEAPDINIKLFGAFGSRNESVSTRLSANSSPTGDCLYFSADNLPSGDTLLSPLNDDCFFEIDGVTIGKDFHWQQKERQRFKGSLILRNDGKVITVINLIPVEEYLKSVISSEMNPKASLEFLKAHAIISRTWVLNRLRKENRETGNPEGSRETGNPEGNRETGYAETVAERIRWYDDSEHVGFDVCADDHCQRYQGISRITNPNAIKAVESTAGQVLTSDGEIIDARFSKCCGGAFETFENCWQPTHKPCLEPGRDFTDTHLLLDLTSEDNAKNWIEGSPDAFCNTADTEVLSQVLNDYDLNTKNFYRWRLQYSRDELSSIIRNRSGIEFGDVIDLIPMQRGVSGRIVRLKIVGTKRSMIIGKELEIRRTLSNSHLYSSAFTIEKAHGNFILSGAGWGHGVGLCQIGAAMMAHLGYTHREILAHYYPGSALSTI